MKNNGVLLILDQCQDELDRVKGIIDVQPLDNVVTYLTKYAIIRACGTIEVAFKMVITDHCSNGSMNQVKNFIQKSVREGSQNPSYDQICTTLKLFDENWLESFKKRITNHLKKDEILFAHKSLVAARNQFAHGGNPTIAIDDTIKYYQHCRISIDIMDEIVR